MANPHAAKEATEELVHWLQNMDRNAADEIVGMIGRILASLPGGEEAEDFGYAPFDWMGWKELELLTDVIHSIEGKKDVEEVIKVLFSSGDEEESA